jgi:hypothetical protein
MLSTIEIHNFRGFANLQLQNLGLVNLVVGRNNTGKTSFLEAISILANWNTVRWSSIFRENLRTRNDNFNPWLIRDAAPDHLVRILGNDEKGEFGVAFRPTAVQSPWPDDVTGISTFGQVSIGTIKRQSQIKASTISVHHQTTAEMADSFAEAVRPSGGEPLMESLLQSVDARVKSIRLDKPRGEQPLIVVDMGLSRKLPLSEAGQGVYRLVSIFSELLGQRPEICFIDEIENGIHYSALPQLWKGVAEVAERLNVQVFATTHSSECLRAAHEAFSTRPGYDLRVVQLYRKNGCIEGRVLDQDLIKAGLDGDIDLR